jgi:RIO kinase 1
MRQHQKVLSTLPTTRNGTQGIKGEADTEADMPLPARNARRGGVVQGEEDVGKGLTARQRRAVLRRLNGGEEVDGEAVAVASSSTCTVSKPPAPNMKKKPLPPVSLGGVPSAPKHSSLSANQKDKADRATVDQVLDSRTRAVLQSLIRRGLVSRIEGCVSTGKEANVYFAPGPKEEPVELSESKTYPRPYPANLALKIYKTSILSFKSRSQYIQGEHRFRNAYTKVANPRKMVKVWAEKELRNLRRLREGGVRCPRVVDVRENVLVMEFLGSEAPPTLPHISGLALPSSSSTTTSSKPSPSEPTERSPAGQEESESSRASKRLKDADIDTDELRELYAELLVAMRWMFRRCRLVHTDLSEYNIL